MELFFDLVYVLAVTQLSHQLLEHLTIGGVLKVDELEDGYAFAFRAAPNGPPDSSSWYTRSAPVALFPPSS